MVHVVCALMLYVLWWKVRSHKPSRSIPLKTRQKNFDAIQPTVIDPLKHVEFAEFVALMLIGGGLRSQGYLQLRRTSERCYFWWYGQ